MSTKLLFSRREAGEMLGVSLRTIDSLLRTGKLAGSVRIGRHVLIPVERLQQFAAQQ
jgi:excisionase family DNA binding protein